MKKLEVNQMENLEGGKFWGSETKNIGDCGPQGQFQVTTYYTFWIGVSYDYNYVPC